MAKAAKRSKKDPEIIDEDDFETTIDDDSDDFNYTDLGGLPAIAAEDLIERVTLPQRPGTNVTFDIGCDWINRVCTEEQRKQIDVYVYRTWPIIMRELDPRNINTATGDCPKHIDVVSLAYSKLDRAYMISQHGGGKYKLLVNDISRSEKSHSYTLFTMHLDIPTDEAEPKLNLKELVKEDLKNRSYVNGLINRGIMNRDGDILADTKAKESSESSVLGTVVQNLMSQVQTMSDRQIEMMRRNAPDDVAMQKAIELAAKGGEKSMEFMLAMLKDKKDPLELLIPLLGLIQKSQTPASDGLTTKDVLVMMQQQQSQQAEMFKLMLSMERDKREEREEKQSISTLIKDIQAIQSLSGNLSGNTPWYASLVENAAPILSQGLGLVSTIVAARSGVKTAPVPATPTTPTNSKYPQPAPIQRDANGERISNPQVAAPMQPEPETQAINPLAPAVQQYGGLILTALIREEPGDVFADNIAALVGYGQVESIQQYGADNLITAMQSVPEFWQGVVTSSSEKALRRFVTEFCNYQPEEESDPSSEPTSRNTP